MGWGVGKHALIFAIAVTAACGQTRKRGEGSPDARADADLPRSVNVFFDRLSNVPPSKVDLLFVVDNSAAMGDKQSLFGPAAGELVARLLNPRCVDETRRVVATPGDPTDACPEGSEPEFEPLRDLHAAVISSSLGGFGSGACSAEEENDRAHLLGSLPRAASLGLTAPGFVSFEGDRRVSEPSAEIEALVRATGEHGCDFAAPLEAMVRFLVDPVPYESVAVAPCAAGNNNPCALPIGIDQELLAQRAAFLRPDSLVAIALLSDEDDCSLQSTGQLYYPARPDVVLPRASSACAEDPNDRCCYSCGTNPPDGCAADPACSASSSADDPVRLRCFDHKRRFGIEFLHPVERYVNALRQFTLCPARASLDSEGCSEPYMNPLYVGGQRSQSTIFLAGVVGVPWQDLAVREDPRGNTVPDGELRFPIAEQLEDRALWDRILGDAASSPPVPPADPLMIPSIDPRTGIVPSTGEALAPPSAGPLANSINGHEWANPARDDLQYACTFPLSTPRDCATVDASVACDCRGNVSAALSPLCQDPATGEYGPVQHAAKAYPGLRELEVLRDFGLNAAVGSICPRRTTVPTSQDFGYRSALSALVEAMVPKLRAACLGRSLQDPGLSCLFVEARPEARGGCPLPGSTELPDELKASAYDRLELNGDCGGGVRSCDDSAWTLCEIPEAGPDCLESGPITSSGWCYIDPAAGLGDPKLVEHCPAQERRLLRFVDPLDRIPAEGAVTLISCLGVDIEHSSERDAAR